MTLKKEHVDTGKQQNSVRKDFTNNESYSQNLHPLTSFTDTISPKILHR
jgi:hypothetical protein